MIYREANSRYIAIKYSVRGRDLGSTVEEAIRAVNKKVKLPEGYRLDWAGEYESQKRANARLAIIVPVTVLLIFFILYSPFDSFKWAFLILVNVAHCAHRRHAGPAGHRHALQRVVRRRLAGAVRRFRADRRHHGGVHQPVARAGTLAYRTPPSKAPSCGSGPS